MKYEWLDNETVERLLESIRAVNADGLDLESLAAAPVLENYRTAIGAAFALSGTVHGHPRLRDGREIVTSQLFYLDPDLGIARTMNRWYRLGSRHRSGGH